MNYISTFSLYSAVVLCLIKFSNANDFGANVMMHRIEGWQSNILKQNVINENCLNQLTKWYDLLKFGPVMADNWAWRMLDSWGKMNPGILMGNNYGLGQMDECLAIDELYDEMSIKGQYCRDAIYIPIQSFPYPIPINQRNTSVDIINENFNSARLEPGIWVSICIPHECKWTELFGIEGLRDKCQTKHNQEEWNREDWSFIVFMICIIVLVVISSFYDWYLRLNGTKPVHPLTLAFSFYTNGEKLLKITSNPEQLQSLNGIRAIGMMWILIGHRFQIQNALPKMSKDTSFTLIQNAMVGAPVAVDSFFFLTGVVMAYGFMKSQCKPKARFNIVLFYVHRYLRLTPAVAVLYFFYVTVYKSMSSGPMWPMIVEPQRKACLDNAVGYFLYIQNILNPSSTCLGQTWYLSVDMQFFVISPLILIPMVKYRKYAGYGLVALVLLSVLPPILIIYFNDILDRSEDNFKLYYAQPHTRIGPWLVGLLLGYIFYQLRDRKIKINRVLNLCMWAIVLIGMFCILWVASEMQHTENVFAFALYSGFHRLCWALGLMWIVFACEYGYGGFVNWFLTLSIFQIWARISYSMYLLHVVVQYIAIFRKRTPINYEGYNLLNEACGDLLIVSVVAFFYCMMFESPFVVIEKILFGPNVIKSLGTAITKLRFRNKKSVKEAKHYRIH